MMKDKSKIKEQKFSTIIKKTKQGIILYFVNDSLNDFTESEFELVINSIESSFPAGKNFLIKNLFNNLVGYRFILFENGNISVEKR